MMRRLFVVGMMLSAATAAAQSPSIPTAAKDAGVATIFGFLLPGGGQYYAEETGRGLLITAATGAAVGAGFLASHGRVYTQELVNVPITGSNLLGLEFRKTLVRDADYTPAKIGAGVGVMIWMYGILDAGGAARRANEKRSRVSVIANGQEIGIGLRF